MPRKSYLHALRTVLEVPVFDELREKYGQVLKEWWDSAETFPTSDQVSNTVLMVERRIHPNMEFCLQNFMYFTRDQGFSLTIVCSQENEPQIREILGRHVATTDLRVIWESNPDVETARSDYNSLFKSAEFWESIPAEFVLSVQTDCYLRHPLPDFLLDYDYVASPWAWEKELVGGSGLTFRRREAVIDMCKRGVTDLCEGEDVFFSKMCVLLEKKVLPFDDAIHIFSESCFVDDPIGVHQWWTYLGQSNDTEIVENNRKLYTSICL